MRKTRRLTSLVSDTIESKAVQPLIQAALREDAARRDLTSQRIIPHDLRVRARIIAKAPGVLAGAKVAAWTFQMLDPSIRCVLKRRDGSQVTRGQTILTVEGRARSILAAERTALNFLSHLCGIATLTRRYVERNRGTRAQIFDTRKTIPGLRALEKHAVRAGGGRNHRTDLSEAILIKSNHLKALRHGTGDMGRVIPKAVRQAKRRRPRRFVEVEVTTLSQFQAALTAKPNAILLDNMSLHAIRRAVHMSHVSRLMSPVIEVSGGVTLANVRAIAKTGVGRISIGRLTHSAPALDVALEVAKSRDTSIFARRERRRK